MARGWPVDKIDDSNICPGFTSGQDEVFLGLQTIREEDGKHPNKPLSSYLKNY